MLSEDRAKDAIHPAHLPGETDGRRPLNRHRIDIAGDLLEHGRAAGQRAWLEKVADAGESVETFDTDMRIGPVQILESALLLHANAVRDGQVRTQAPGILCV